MMEKSIITGLHHIAILCAEREASLRFYEALGFHVIESHVRPERKDEVIFMEQQGCVDGPGIVLELLYQRSIHSVCRTRKHTVCGIWPLELQMQRSLM